MTKTILSLAVLFALTGCASSQTKESYNIDIYNDGKLVRSFEDVKLTESLPGKVRFVSSGTPITYAGQYAVSSCSQLGRVAPETKGTYAAAKCAPIAVPVVRVD